MALSKAPAARSKAPAARSKAPAARSKASAARSKGAGGRAKAAAKAGGGRAKAAAKAGGGRAKAAGGRVAQAAMTLKGQPAPRVRQVRIGDLVPYEANARKHSKRQLEQIAKSIREFGWIAPVIIDDRRNVLAGHGRIKAAGDILGLDRAPCVEVGHLTPEQRRAYILADNRIAEGATWDEKLLAVELSQLQALAVDVSALGFSVGELRKYVPAAVVDEAEGDPEPEPVPEPPARPVSRPGDLWLLADHRLLCGDATSRSDVTRVLAGGLAPVITVTDPPYGMSYDAGWRDGVVGKVGLRSTGLVRNDDRADWRAAFALFPGDVAYVWCSSLTLPEVGEGLGAAGFERRALIVWNKQYHVISRGHYHWKHETCWYAVRKGGRARWRGDRAQTTVWDIENASAMGGKRDDAVTGHGTQKPIACMLRPILNHTVEGEAAFDPFMGSGTTIIGAEQKGRVAYGIEIDPAYCDVAVRRWQNFTGRAALLAEDGRMFSETETARANGVRKPRRRKAA